MTIYVRIEKNDPKVYLTFCDSECEAFCEFKGNFATHEMTKQEFIDYIKETKTNGR